MHIEIWQSTKTKNVDGKSIGKWYWHKMNVGRITTDAEPFVSMANAFRAARADVMQTIKPYAKRISGPPVKFDDPKWNAKKQCWIIRWS